MAHNTANHYRFDLARITRMPWPEMVITLSYMVLGSIWIVLSDQWLDRLTGDPEVSLALQTFKGLNFIITSSLVYYLILRRSFARRHKAELAARLNQQRFECVALATTDAIWDWDMVQNKMWWSEDFERLFGQPVAALGDSVDALRDRLHPSERDLITNHIRSTVDAGGNLWSLVHRLRCKDDRYATVLVRGLVIRDADGQPARVIGGIKDITEERLAKEKLEQSRQQLRGLLARLQTTREEERTRIAREIHDDLGQLLTALKMDLRWLERKLDDGVTAAAGPLLDKLVESGNLVDDAIAGVQRISGELRPSALDQLGLVPALQQEVEKFTARSGLQCEVQLPEEIGVLPPPVATAIFRICQEALTNVARHANATAVRVALCHEAGQIVLEVEDDGSGIAPGALADPQSFGLLGMRERAVVLGGEVRVQPGRVRGTSVTLRLPLQAEAGKSGEYYAKHPDH